MFRLWHILAIITVGALLVFTGELVAGGIILGIAIGLGLGGIFGYKHEF